MSNQRLSRLNLNLLPLSPRRACAAVRTVPHVSTITVLEWSRMERWQRPDAPGSGTCLMPKRGFPSHTKYRNLKGLGSAQRRSISITIQEWYSNCPYRRVTPGRPLRVRGTSGIHPCWPAGPRMLSGIAVALPLIAVSSQSRGWLIRGPLFFARVDQATGLIHDGKPDICEAGSFAYRLAGP
jgi:hypothetical protein